MSDSTFTFRVDTDLKARFAATAKAMDRTGAQLLRDYMREVVQRHADAPAGTGGMDVKVESRLRQPERGR